MRGSRLLSILMTLQTRGRTTAEALAAQFEVSVRTIYRDIDQLSAADVPVYADRGPGGGFQLLDGYRTRLTGLTTAEAETLFLAGLPGPAAELGLAEVMAAAELKLTAALPEKARPGARRIAARFHLDPVDWFRSVESASLLPVLAKAVWNETIVDIRYRRGDGAVARQLRPLGLVLKAGTWYCVAAVGDARDAPLRTYRVGGILDLSPTDERFERPRDFDLVHYWTASTRAYEVGVYRSRATLRLSKLGLERLDQLGTAVQQAARETMRPTGRKGWSEVTIPSESIDQATLDLLRLGSEVEVMKPAALRRRIARVADEIRRRNR